MQIDNSETLPSVADTIFHRGFIAPPGAITLFEDSRVIALLLSKGDAADLMEEVGRLRSLTFASMGLKNEYGLDIYDDHYQQIITLDKDCGAIVGGLRVGLGDKILAEQGEHGLYLTKYWHFSGPLLEIVHQSIDIGRLWIQPAYQKQRWGFLVVWKAMLTFLYSTHHPFFLGFIGLADSAYPSREIFMNYLWHYYRTDSQLALSRHPVMLTSYAQYSHEHRHIEAALAYRKVVAELEKNDPDYPFPLHVRYLPKYDIKLIGDFSEDSLDNEILCLFIWTREGMQPWERFVA